MESGRGRKQKTQTRPERGCVSDLGSEGFWFQWSILGRMRKQLMLRVCTCCLPGKHKPSILKRLFELCRKTCALRGVRHGGFAPASFECGCSLLCHTRSRFKLQASLLANFANSRAQEVTKAHSIELKQAAMTWIEELQAFCWGQKTWDAACKNCSQKTASSWKPWMRRHRPPKRDNENKTE